MSQLGPFAPPSDVVETLDRALGADGYDLAVSFRPRGYGYHFEVRRIGNAKTIASIRVDASADDAAAAWRSIAKSIGADE